MKDGKRMGKKRKDYLDPHCVLVGREGCQGLVKGLGDLGGAESGSGLPTLGNSVIGEHCFPYKSCRRDTTVRPLQERGQSLVE